MRKVLLLSVSSFLLFLCSAQANDTAFGGSGASPMPIDQPQVSMQSEHIVIRGDGLNRADMGGSWHFDCIYFFKNATNKKLAFTMGFPFPVYKSDEGDVAVPAGIKLKQGQPLVHNFIVKLDGKTIKASRQSINPNPQKKMHYKDAYIWKMKFTPKQRVKVEHTYRTGATFDVMGHNWVSYVLRTGGLWKGNSIAHARLEVIPNTPTRLCHEIDSKGGIKPTPAGLKIVGKGQSRKYIWDLHNFKPSADLSLCLQTGRHYVQYQIVTKLATMANQKNYALKKLSLSQLQMLRNTIYAQYGRQFNNKKLQRHFNSLWWYQPNPKYSDKMLSKQDKIAIAFIQKLESLKAH